MPSDETAVHGMQKVRGSNPLSSTGSPDLCSIIKYQAKDLKVLGFLVPLVGVVAAEYVVHHGSLRRGWRARSRGGGRTR
jgi:hypothetical protein